MKSRFVIPTFAALAMAVAATPALSQETRTLTARWVLDVEVAKPSRTASLL